MRSESQVELSLAEQRLIRNRTSLLFFRALYWCSGRTGRRGWPTRWSFTFVQTWAIAWTTELFAVLHRAWRPSGPNGHPLCVSNTLFKTCSFAKNFDNRMPGAADANRRHGRQRDFPESAGSRWESGALSVHDRSSQF